MGELAAKEGDFIEGTDTHMVITDPLTGPKPIPGHKFKGELCDDLSENVFFEGKAAAYVGSIAKNSPPHTPNGMSFGKNPKNEGEITASSLTPRPASSGRTSSEYGLIQGVRPSRD